LPYSESSAPALGQRILAGRPERPRRLNSALSADQELVCLTAMEPDAARRYATAADFARDLSNLLARRPIEARAPGAWQSVRHFAQRRPALATALSLGLAAAIIAPLVYGLQESRARDALQAERDAALDAVEFLLERVGHSDLRDVPRVERLRAELLERATQLYARLDAAPRSDARTQLRSASALGKLARLRKDAGDLDGAMRDFTAAEARLRALAAERARDPETLFELGNVLAFATVARHPTPSVEAVAAMDDAVALLRRAVALDAQARRPRNELARGLCGLAHYQQSTGAPDAARASWTEALELCARLRDEEPADRDALEVWITARARISGLDWSLARYPEGEQGFRPASCARCARSGHRCSRAR
jgi:serine/threonine-protein kinase